MLNIYMDYYFIIFVLITVFLFITHYIYKPNITEFFSIPHPTCALNTPFITGQGIYNLDYTLDKSLNMDGNYNQLSAIDQIGYNIQNSCPDGSKPSDILSDANSDKVTGTFSYIENKRILPNACDQTNNPYYWYIKSGILKGETENSTGYTKVDNKLLYSKYTPNTDKSSSLHFYKYRSKTFATKDTIVYTKNNTNGSFINFICNDITNSLNNKIKEKIEAPTAFEMFDYIVEMYPNCIQFREDHTEEVYYYDINQQPSQLIDSAPLEISTVYCKIMEMQTSVSFFITPNESTIDKPVLKWSDFYENDVCTVNIQDGNLVIGTKSCKDDDTNLSDNTVFIHNESKLGYKFTGLDSKESVTQNGDCDYKKKSDTAIYQPFYISISISNRFVSNKYKGTISAYIYPIPLDVIFDTTKMNFLDYFNKRALTSSSSSQSCYNKNDTNTCTIHLDDGIYMNPLINNNSFTMYYLSNPSIIHYIRNYPGRVDDPNMIAKIPAAFMRQDINNNDLKYFSEIKENVSLIKCYKDGERDKLTQTTKSKSICDCN